MIEPIVLKSRVIRGVRPGPHLLITGGVHGDEFTPMAAVRRLASEIPAAHLAGQVTLVPVVNEAAWLRGRRTADDDLDLARVCPGRADGSVTERTAYSLSRLIQSADFYIDLHTGSFDLALLPLVGYVLHADAEVLDRQRAMARAFQLPILWGTSASLDGRSLSVARDARIPAIYAEYQGSGLCDPAGVEAYAAGCINVMAQLEMISRPPVASLTHTVVEDPRTGSGHMQVQNPSPMTGFFTPTVPLGDRVELGDVIGTVTDILGEMIQAVPADRSGLVIGVRTFPRVLENESVVVILEDPGSGYNGPDGSGRSANVAG